MILAEMTPLNSRRSSAAHTDTPAKINLTLDILGRRPDGYHELRSLVIGVDLRDTLRVELAPGSGPTIDCESVELCSQGNLALQAAVRLARYLDRPADVHLQLVKRIPLGGGLGGGSSDAAAALRLCNQLWGAGLEEEQLARLGAELGSDVPLFFHLPSAIMTGRGDRVVAAPIQWRGWVLLLLPDLRTSTADVYRAWKPADSGGLSQDTSGQLVQCRTAAELSGLLSNHLEPAVFRVEPRLRELRDAVNASCGGPVRVSGSGASMYLLFDDPQSAAAAAAKVHAAIPPLKTVVAGAPVGGRSIDHM
jgi:4-diphosphocytidyl-2-C-methyl-D-erythritol kinase